MKQLDISWAMGMVIISSVSRFRFTRIVSKYDESTPRSFSKVASRNFFIHVIVRLDVRAVKRIRGYVADLILVVVYILNNQTYASVVFV